jgi:hypothetical protein
MASRPLRIAVGIATAGRRDIAPQTVALLRNQTRLSDIVVVCPLVSDEINDGDFLDLPFDVLVTSGPVGLCAQRNAILATASYCDVIIFFDDDFLPNHTISNSSKNSFGQNPKSAASRVCFSPMTLLDLA